jgi:hypothetical protein
MKLFMNFEKAFKNGLYLDYFVKNIVMYFYKKIIGVNFLYLMDKYLVEKFFYNIKTFANHVNSLISVLKSLSFNQIIKLMIIVIIQIIILIIL